MSRIALALIFTLAACAPSAIPYERVRVTTDPAIPANCKFLGEVAGGGQTQANTSPTAGTVALEVDVQKDPIVSLRQAAADLGGNTVTIVDYGNPAIGSTALCHAYDCRGYNPGKE